MKSLQKCLRILFVFTAFTSTSVLALADNFAVKSSTFKDGATLTNDQVFNSFGCSGKNISPDLSWTGVPAGTKSFAITMYDPDAPTGSGWWHWVVFNIPASATQIVADAGNSAKKLMPKGAVQSRTDFGKPGYGGPCPPPGSPHHYVLKVYALKDILPLKADSPAAMVGFYIGQNKLAEFQMTALYGR